MGLYTAVLMTVALSQTGATSVDIPDAEIGDAQVRASIQRSIPHIEKQGVWWIENKKCMSCHRVGMMIWSLNEARRHGFEVSERLDDWIGWSVETSLSKNDKGNIVGAGNKEGVAQLLRTLDGSDRFTAEQEQLVSLIVDNQEANGSWKPDGQLPGQKRPKPETAVVSTMWNALAVARASSDGYDKAMTFLAASQPGKSTEWYVAKLLLAVQANDTEEVAKRVAELRSQQRDDGGWGWLTGDESDALATGMSLYALCEAAVPLDDPAVIRATKLLVDTQQPDGSWKVRGTKENKKKQIEETASYWGTTWAVLGMLRVLPQPSS